MASSRLFQHSFIQVASTSQWQPQQKCLDVTWKQMMPWLFSSDFSLHLSLSLSEIAVTCQSVLDEWYRLGLSHQRGVVRAILLTFHRAQQKHLQSRTVDYLRRGCVQPCSWGPIINGVPRASWKLPIVPKAIQPQTSSRNISINCIYRRVCSSKSYLSRMFANSLLGKGGITVDGDMDAQDFETRCSIGRIPTSCLP